MKRRFASLALLLGALPALAAETIVGRVIGVADGDTLTILVDHRTTVIRLDGIDAPEKGQPFGQAAKRQLSELAFDRTVTATCSKVDRYKRHVCAVHVEGSDAGEALIASGHAWVFTRYVHELTAARRAAYERAECTARDERRGLWGDPSPTSPWEWRQTKRSPPDDMGTWGH
jgi:endonuclease YncB( thermonuclease family)